jgi:hypothetical protein
MYLILTSVQAVGFITRGDKVIASFLRREIILGQNEKSGPMIDNL